MGLFSWFSTTTKKSTAAVLVESALESLAKSGLFEVHPTTLANRVVEDAFTKLPVLANERYNKYILAVTTLTMVQVLPSFSKYEKEACKHALGILLKHILELQMSNAIALTLSEEDILEKSQLTFLAAMKPSLEINFG